jgi:erythronate-4-phosphate dehydrogenase
MYIIYVSLAIGSYVNSHPTIIADENIPFVRKAFEPLGNLVTLSGRDMNAITIRDADILIVRSITRVDELLIGKSSVQYIATASTGYDHIDTDYLKVRDIEFFAAAGCNANAVAEYTIVAIAALCLRYGLRMDEITLGIVGVGRIGMRVAEKAAVLGITTLMNDPPLKDKTGDNMYLPLHSVLGRSDIVTVHVPLITTDVYPTIHMMNENFIGMMKPDALLINTSRGAVVDEHVLLGALTGLKIGNAVLDVWENEPAINVKLLENVAIGTPHIAGHSIDGRVNATVMVYRDLCRFLNVKAAWEPDGLPEPEQPVIEIVKNLDPEKTIPEVLFRAYPIYTDDERMRGISRIKVPARAHYFDTIRSQHRSRREFNSYRLNGFVNEIADTLIKLGFKR